jgi:hypothetical protein
MLRIIGQTLSADMLGNLIELRVLTVMPEIKVVTLQWKVLRVAFIKTTYTIIRLTFPREMTDIAWFLHLSVIPGSRNGGPSPVRFAIPNCLPWIGNQHSSYGILRRHSLTYLCQ